MRRRLVIAVLATVGALVACRTILPERFAVNAPLPNLIWGGGIDAAPPETFGRRVRAADGFTVTLYARDLDGARFLRFTPTGDLLVSQPRGGKITLLERDADADGHPDGVHTLVDGLDRPHGMDITDGWLYVGETGAVGRIRFDAARRATDGSFTRLAKLPPGGNHWTRTVRIGPDHRLYVSLGSDCNVCLEKDERRAAMLRFALDGSGQTIYARGLRNAVGFDWQPGTGDLYATDNGRDLLGDDFPPDELNRIVEGGFYGWPFANGDRVPDPDFGAGHEADIARSIPPAHEFHPHNAPLGITFVRGERVPAAYRGAALVALHGSWNRTKKDGYKVVSLHWAPDGTITERDFLFGFLDHEDVIGRPVDVAEGPDGAFYVSDDYAGSIYRVAYGAGAASGAAGAPAAGAAPGSVGTARAPTTKAATPSTREPLAGLSADERAAGERRGRELFTQHACASCHDAAAAPGVAAPRLTTLGRRYTISSLADFLAAPTPPMPVFPLSADERRALAIYLLATYP